MLVEFSVMEQRYQAVLALIRGGPCRGAYSVQIRPMSRRSASSSDTSANIHPSLAEEGTPRPAGK